jgi:hypothetical protein
MQRLCLEILRQMPRLFKKHFGGAHVRHYDAPQISLNQARMRLSEKREPTPGPPPRIAPDGGRTEKGN